MPDPLARSFAAMALSAAVLLTGCSGGSQQTAEAQTLRVFAAASLAESLTDIGEQFSNEHGIQVQFSFAGSADLAAQISQGAPADVFVSADERTVQRLIDAEDVLPDPVLIASNQLVIGVPAGNPDGVESLQDLTDDAVVLVVCAPQVPCGAAAATAAEAAGVELSPVSEENAVTDVLGKVRAGEADAGLVYRTDVTGTAGAEVEGIEFAESSLAINHYQAVQVAAADNARDARAFIDYLQKPQARAVLSDAGFGEP